MGSQGGGGLVAYTGGVSSKPPLPRAVRVARGAGAALAATLLAAASHSLAGGAITPLAVAATTLVALPLCVLLAGKLASLWRLAIAVSAAQLLYHWSFAGLGLASVAGQSHSGLASAYGGAHAHAAMGGALSLLIPGGAGFAEGAELANPQFVAHTAGAAMWLSHAIAAALTITLLHQGERAWLLLWRVLRAVLPRHLPQGGVLPARVLIRAEVRNCPRLNSQHFLLSLSHRGPPVMLLPR